MTVPQDCDSLSDGVDVRHPVRDEDDRDSPLLEVSDDPVQRLAFVDGQRCRRFVENDDGGIIGKRFQDLDQLALRDTELAHLRLRIKMDIDPVHQLLRIFIELIIVNKTMLCGQTSGENVFRNG